MRAVLEACFRNSNVITRGDPRNWNGFELTSNQRQRKLPKENLLRSNENYFSLFTEYFDNDCLNIFETAEINERLPEQKFRDTE